MGLTKKQRKQIRQKIKNLPLEKVAAELNLELEEIKAYLKKIWRKEKYQRFLDKKEGSKNQTSRLAPWFDFNFKKWLEQNWKVLAFLAFLVLAVYFNSLNNDFLSDDIASIRDNPEINKISYFWKPPYFNLNFRLLIAFFIHKIFGLKPIFFRLSNIFLHLGSTWLIYLLISLFFQTPIPLMTASLFAVHPILVESVAWISGGTYSNSAFFVLLSFLTYIWSTKKKGWFYSLSVFFFFLALLCSEKLVIFPLILLLYELCFNKLRTNWRKLIPFWLVSGFWALHLVGLLGPRIASLETAHYQKPGLANPLTQIPIAITSYLELIFWPKGLTLYHSEMFFSRSEYLLRLGVFVLFLVSVVYFLKKDRRVFFWLLFFPISLLTTLTPLKISWIVAERYVYLGSLGIFVLIALAIQKIGKISKNQNVSYVLLAFILLALSARTIVRNTDWKNQDRLWIAAAKTSPSSPQNHNNLGDLYARHGNLERAAKEFQIAIQLNPNYGDAHHNLANTYQQMGRIAEAIENYQKALSFNPNIWQSHQNLAAIYFNLGEFELAKQELEKAININPQNSNLYTILGVVYLKSGEKEKARGAFSKALEINPQNERARQGLLSL